VIRHAGLIAIRDGGPWRGVLIEGPSGSGKSDLALRALDQGFRLAADDRVILWACDGRLYGRAPASLSGLIEVRGVDVVRVEPLALCEVALVARSGVPERLARPEVVEVCGVSTPLVDLDFREPSAPAKLRRALAIFDAALKKRI
jgi:serine kinase of HPr protein (carbohydrate metabolism regulator)